MPFILKMNPKYRCPACHSEEILEFDEYIHCPNCNLEFFKEFIDSNISEENIFSEEALQAISNAFHDEFDDKKDQKKFLKSIDEDLI
jgi:DNA-directed RNA polymerase subunit RPC12/RpoP